MIRPVLIYPDPALRRRCAAVGEPDDDARALARDLIDSLYAAGGRGLAAPQIGVLRRAFVIDLGWRDGTPAPEAFIDARISAASREVAGGVERCLSIPDRSRWIRRPLWVELRWTDAEGRPREGRLEGAAARCAQHEMDHLEGRLILDHGRDASPEEAAAG